MVGSGNVGATPFDFIIDTIHEWPLLPGEAIQITDASVNVQLTASFRWRERLLEESERT